MNSLSVEIATQNFKLNQNSIFTFLAVSTINCQLYAGFDIQEIHQKFKFSKRSKVSYITLFTCISCISLSLSGFSCKFVFNEEAAAAGAVTSNGGNFSWPPLMRSHLAETKREFKCRSCYICNCPETTPR